MRKVEVVALDRWVDAGLVSSEQRRAIREFESAPEPRLPAEPVPRRRAVFAEVVGSLGALAAVVAAVVGVAQLWSRLEPWARVALPVIGAAVLLAASAAVPAHEDRSLARLGALLGLMGTGAVATAAVVLGDDALGWAGQNVALLAGLGAGVVAVILLRLRREPHQVVAVAASALATAIGLVTQYDHVRVEQVGAVVVAVALALGVAGWGRLLPSSATAYVLSGVGAIVGAQMMGDWSPQCAIAVSAAAAVLFLAAFAKEHARTLLLGGLGLALAGLVRGVIELTGDRRADESGGVGAIAVLFLVGLVLLAAAVVAIRGPKPSNDPADDSQDDSPSEVPHA